MDTQEPESVQWAHHPMVRWGFLALLSAVVLATVISRMWRLPTNALGHYNRGVTDIEKGRYARAIEDLTRAIKLKPDDADFYVSRGYARNRLGDVEEAIADYDQAVKLAPFDAEAYAGRGYSRERRGDNRGAIEDYTQAIALDPRDADAYRGRGSARQKVGEEEAALEDYTRAVELEPKSGRSYFKRANLHYDQRRWQEALYGFREALQRLDDGPSRDRASLLIWLGRARLGGAQGATTELAGYLERRKPGGDDDGFLAAAGFLTGRTTEEALLRKADSESVSLAAEHRCEAYFCAGTKRQIDGDAPGALSLLRKCLGLGLKDSEAFDRAEAEIRNLTFGWRVREIDPELRSSLSLGPGTGLSVFSLRESGPAARAGLKVGDVLITIDGAPASAGRTRDLERNAAKGKIVAVELRRGEEGRSAEIKVGAEE